MKIHSAEQLKPNASTYAAITVGALYGLYAQRKRHKLEERIVETEIGERIENAKARILADRLEEARKEGRVDDLTKLPNRRAFEETYDLLAANAERSGMQLSILVYDLDNFKNVNDTHGHSEGDRVLKSTAESVRSTLRAGDMLARFGGDEHALLLPNTDLEAALQTADKIRRVIQAANMYEVTASIGVHLIDPRQTYEDNFRSADAALYAAKDAGRNTVMPYLPPEES